MVPMTDGQNIAMAYILFSKLPAKITREYPVRYKTIFRISIL